MKSLQIYWKAYTLLGQFQAKWPPSVLPPRGREYREALERRPERFRFQRPQPPQRVFNQRTAPGRQCIQNARRIAAQVNRSAEGLRPRY
jgi:hypothetical protein